ncbi:Iron-sulfur cluster co-chaperone protein HscB, mitochondrial [Chionoecetes opilio]|uniref:Iron-sulfur cluster co-chaperone protein HscB, mitochondrial n=1 Tax=Chionoecetes opilio TaxID=41210 RepID=A0A8J4YWJ8_CHIOP|nr:Iron-sulfur cluster co-chaperone protein HscB, mitochondrial [Chionoecetes opilio]
MALLGLRARAFGVSAVQRNPVLSLHSRWTSGVNLNTTIHLARYIHTADVKTGKDPPKYTALLKQCQAAFSTGLGARQCWKCQNEVPDDTEFCLSCKSLQPLDHHRNHFSILRIQRSFHLDTKALTKRFRRLQAQFHPDRYSVKSEARFLSL